MCFVHEIREVHFFLVKCEANFYLDHNLTVTTTKEFNPKLKLNSFHMLSPLSYSKHLAATDLFIIP